MATWDLIWLINRSFRRLFALAESKSDYFEKKFKLNKFKLITVERQKSIIMGTVKLAKILVILFVLYLALPVMFTVIPFAGDLTEKLIGYVTYPLKTGALAFVAYIPSLITIIVVVYVMRFLVRVMKSLSREVSMGKIVLKGFYPDWAMPTFNLVKFIIYVFTFVLLFPLLPGSGSDVFAGVSLFLGINISWLFLLEINIRGLPWRKLNLSLKIELPYVSIPTRQRRCKIPIANYRQLPFVQRTPLEKIEFELEN